jgi:uncharacterized protein (DUF305 family)
MNTLLSNKAVLLSGVLALIIGLWAGSAWSMGWNNGGGKGSFERHGGMMGGTWDQKTKDGRYKDQFGRGGAGEKGGMMGRGMGMGGMRTLEGKTGDELDRAFLGSMITHHEGAVRMAEQLLKSTSTRPELRTMAENILTAQKKEIEDMRAWQSSWFTTNPN